MINRSILNAYNLLLALGAFYLGISMFLGKGIFDTFPKEWIGILPFSNWASLALFGIIIFGLGNTAISVYGFINKDRNAFLMTIIMGVLFLLCTVLTTILVGEWYLPTSQFLILSIIQIALGIFGFITEKS